MQIAPWIALIAVFVIGKEAFKRAGGTPDMHNVESAVRQAARRNGIPEWILLATCDIESSMRHLRPKNDAGSLSYYPAGMKLNSAQTVKPGSSDEYLRSELKTLDGNLDLACAYLRRGLGKPWGSDDELLRLWYKRPVAAKEAYETGIRPSWFKGKARSLVAWRRVRHRWRGTSQGNPRS